MDHAVANQPPLTLWGQTWRMLLSLAISALVWIMVLERQSRELFLLDLVLGLVAFALLFWRRRRPVAVAAATAVLSAFSSLAAGPSTLAMVSLATRRRWTEVIPLAALGLAAAQLWSTVQPLDPEEPVWLTATTNVIVISAVTAWGLYIGSRRELVWALRQRAERAEAEQELRAGRARDAERARIAREMHDVLAHRISQISLHAGALTFREDLTAPEMRTSAGVIREKAHEALNDLREVLGVLRGQALDAPQPTYADLPGLVEETRRTGAPVEYADRLPADVAVPDATGRTLFRIVQEGITNARKHAPGATLSIEILGSPEEGVEVRMRNPFGFGPSRTPGAGLGLVGLTERAELRGGHLSHGREDSTFVVQAWLPWAA